MVRNIGMAPPTRDGVVIFRPAVAQHHLTYLSPLQFRDGVPWRNSGPKVEMYAQDMLKTPQPPTPENQAGWTLTGASIAYDTEGKIIDGAHRLRACVKANVPFITRVTTGNPTAAFATTDVGLNRSAAQLFKMAGYRDAVVCAAVAYAEAQYECGWGKLSVPSRSFLEWADPIRGLVQDSARWGHSRGPMLQPWLSSSLVAWVHMHLTRAKGDAYAEDFLEGFVSGEGLRGGDPRGALRRQLQQQVMTKLQSGGSRITGWSKTERIALLVLAHNSWARGEKRKTITLPRRQRASTEPARAKTGKDKVREKLSGRDPKTWPQFEVPE